MKEAYKKPEKKNTRLFEFKYTNDRTGKTYILFEYSVIVAEQKMYDMLGADYKPTEFTVQGRLVK